MKKIVLAFLFISSLILFNSCSTDFDLYAEYKDITIVYGIADFSDDTTWLKITKAITGPGNALLITQNPDSSNYSYKLDVTMTGRKNGNDLDPLVFDTITVHNKAVADTIINQNGDTTFINPFYSPDQLVYYVVGSLDKDADYTLTINKNNGESLSAFTGIVDDFHIDWPSRRIVFHITNNGYIKWLSARNGARYLVSMRFNYSEFVSGYSDTLQKSVDLYHKTVNAISDKGGDNMEVTYSGADFFSALDTRLPDIPNVERWAENVEIKIICGSRVLVTYLDINAANANILEEVPTYSNIDGGTGIFASRHTIVTPIPLSTTTEYYLITHYDLGFRFKQK